MRRSVKNIDLFQERFQDAVARNGVSYGRLSQLTGLSKASLSLYGSGKATPSRDSLQKIAVALEVTETWLSGDSVEKVDDCQEYDIGKLCTFPVLGQVAAGYNSYAYEDETGETVTLPLSKLRGRDKSDHFVLEVKGDSMTPYFMEGDRVLILRQSTVENGHVAVVMYGDELGTLKKVEYGKGWVRLVPFNPDYQTVTIRGSDLESFRILGVPRYIMTDWCE